MNKIIKTKLDKIIDYAKSGSSGVEELIVFGEALSDNRESAIIRLAARFNEDLDVEDRFDCLLVKVDEITGGRFELLIMNGDNLVSNTLHEIEQGEIIYDSRKQNQPAAKIQNSDQ